MSTITETFTAGQTKEFMRPSTYLKVFKTTTPIDIIFYRDNQPIYEDAIQVEAGYGIHVPLGFNRYTITSAEAQSVTVFVSSGTIDYDRTVGSVQIGGVASINDYGQTYGVSFQSNSAAAPLNIIAAASNVNGLKLINARRYDVVTGPGHSMVALLAKASAPANLRDGDVLAFKGAEIAFAPATAPQHGAMLIMEQPIRIASGLRLDYYQNTVIVYCESHAKYNIL